MSLNIPQQKTAIMTMIKDWPYWILHYGLLQFLFAFALNPWPHLLAQTAPVVIWSILVMFLFPSYDRDCQQPHHFYVLEKSLLAGRSYGMAMVSLAARHWGAAILPLILVQPFLNLFFDQAPELKNVLQAMIFLTPSLSLSGVAIAILSCGLRQSFFLKTLLLLPLQLPILILGLGMAYGRLSLNHFELCFALFAFQLLLCYWLGGYGLKLRIEER